MNGVVCLVALALAQAPATPAAPSSPQPVPLVFDKQIATSYASPPYGYRGKEYPLVRIGKIQFHQEAGSRLTATAQGSIMTAAKVDYDLTVTVYDAAGKQLGSAKTVEHVELIELGHVPMMVRKWSFDFGKPLDAGRARTFAVTITEAKPAKAPDAKAPDPKAPDVKAPEAKSVTLVEATGLRVLNARP